MASQMLIFKTYCEVMQHREKCNEVLGHRQQQIKDKNLGATDIHIVRL